MTRKTMVVSLALVTSVSAMAIGGVWFYVTVLKPGLQVMIAKAEKGDPETQTQLGAMYEHGGVFPAISPDPVQAAIWYRKAAEQGYGEAELFLSLLYLGGKGVTRDDQEGVVWMRRSAQHGSALGQMMLGRIYSKAYNGVSRDPVQAAEWFRKSAEQGSAAAQTFLGEAYADGTGVVQDDIQAVGWYRKAADQGDAAGQHHLGQMYAAGRGVSRDDAEAFKWYTLAAQAPRPDERNFISEPDLLAKRMSSMQIAEGRERARRWRKTAEHR